MYLSRCSRTDNLITEVTCHIFIKTDNAYEIALKRRQHHIMR